VQWLCQIVEVCKSELVRFANRQADKLRAQYSSLSLELLVAMANNSYQSETEYLPKLVGDITDMLGDSADSFPDATEFSNVERAFHEIGRLGYESLATLVIMDVRPVLKEFFVAAWLQSRKPILDTVAAMQSYFTDFKDILCVFYRKKTVQFTLEKFLVEMLQKFFNSKPQITTEFASRMCEDANELEKLFMEQRGVNPDVVQAQLEVVNSISSLSNAILNDASGPVVEYSNLARNYPNHSMTILRFVCARVSPSLNSSRVRQIVEDCEAAGAIQARSQASATSHQQKTGRALLAKVFQETKDDSGLLDPADANKSSKGRFFGFGGKNKGDNLNVASGTTSATPTTPTTKPGSSVSDGMNIPVMAGEDLFGGIALPKLEVNID